MAKESSAISLTSTFYLRNFYKQNTSAFKSSTRKTYSSDEKSYEDSRALRRAARQLSSYSYDDNDNKDNLVSAVLAYVDTYNNTISSAADSSDSDVTRYAKKLKTLTAEYSDELEALGITIEKDGTLSVNSDYLEEHDTEDFKNVFDSENGYMSDIMSLSKKITNKAYSTLYEQLTGNGTLLNITI